MTCIICSQPIDEKAEFACIWDEGDAAAIVGFAHLQCSEGLEDITDEIKGFDASKDG